MMLKPRLKLKEAKMKKTTTTMTTKMMRLLAWMLLLHLHS